MNDTLKKLVSLPAPSGDEKKITDFIREQIKDYADEISTDALGNLIVFKKGANRPSKKLLLDAHCDEVGLMITGADDKGYLHFATLGGIDAKVMFGKRVKIGDNYGVIGGCAVHLLDSEKRKKVMKADELYIDIGAVDKADALSRVSIGDTAVFDSDYIDLGERVAARGLDDKIGCAIMIEMIKSELEYDTYFSFSTQEEIGCRGARVASYTVNPDCAIVIESTTAADLYGVPSDKTVCVSGNGAALSLMDNGTLYDKNLVQNILKKAEQNAIFAQAKTAVAGGNDSGAIHLSRNGVKTVAMSLPCRYIHSAYCVASKADMKSLFDLVNLIAPMLSSGEL